MYYFIKVSNIWQTTTEEFYTGTSCLPKFKIDSFFLAQDIAGSSISSYQLIKEYEIEIENL